MASQSLTSDTFTTSNSDKIYVKLGTEAEGKFIVDLDIDTYDAGVGDTIKFDVVPATPGIVYSRVSKCAIVHNGEEMALFGADGNFCKNEYVGFELIEGWGSQ